MKRVFLPLGGGLLLGSLAASFLTESFSFWMFGGVLLLLAAAFWVTEHPKSAALFLAASALGFFCFLKAEAPFRAFTLPEAETVPLSGTVQQIDPRMDGHYRYTVSLHEDRTLQVVLTASDEIPDLSIGDRLSAAVRPYLPIDNGWFDGVRYAKSEHILYYAYLNDPENAVILPALHRAPIRWIQQASQSYRRKLAAHPTLSAEVSAVLQSVLLGDRSLLDPALQQSYANVGAAHLFAVSGLHLMLLCGIFFACIPKRFTKTRLAVLTALIFCYLLLTGGHPSTIRSGIMIWTGLLAPCFHRRDDGANTLSLTVFVMLLCDPLAVLDIGFLLSVSAMGGILFLAPPLSRIVHQKIRLGIFRAAADKLLVSFSAQAALFPVLAVSFGYCSLLSPLWNLILLPLMTPILLFGFFWFFLLSNKI